MLAESIGILLGPAGRIAYKTAGQQFMSGVRGHC